MAETPTPPAQAPSPTDEGPWEIVEGNTHVSLTHAPLSIPSIIDRVRSPQAGAIVMFAGTTRDNFANAPVSTLRYTSYIPLALRTLSAIATALSATHSLRGIAITHRLGEVPIGHESIVIAVSSPHRAAAWRAGEEALEECKRRVEVWKSEVLADTGEGVWRANRDWTGDGGKVEDKGMAEDKGIGGEKDKNGGSGGGDTG